MALCVTCSFPPAWAATDVAAKTARVPHGRKAACIHGRLACAFVRLRRPKAPLREPFLPLLAPLHAALPCCGGGVISALDARKARPARQRARPFGPPSGRFPRKKCHFSCQRAKILFFRILPAPAIRPRFVPAEQRWLRLFFVRSPIYRGIKTI